MKSSCLQNVLAIVALVFGLSLLMSGCFTGPNDEELCSNTCQYANDGECDDGGPGSITSLCPCATDCADCAERSELECDGGSGSSGSSSSSSSSSGGGYTQQDAGGSWFGTGTDGYDWQLYLCSNDLFTFRAYNPVGELQFEHTGTWSISGTTLSLTGSNNWTFQIIEITTSGSGAMTITSSGNQVVLTNQLTQDPCSTTGSSSSSSSGSSSSSSSGGGSTYNVVFVMTPGQGASCGALFGCTGNMTFEVRVASSNQLVMNDGVLDPCGPTYDGVNGSNPPYCNSSNTEFLPNLQEGVTYEWTSTCSTQNGPNEDSGTFTEGTGSSFTSDGCRRIAIY